MSASALLFELRAAGVTLAATGDQLRVEADPGIITPELAARMKAFKPDLLAILAGDTEAALDPVALDPVALEQCAEFDRIIGDLCAAVRFTDDIRDLMLATRRRMSCDAMRAELPIMRGKLLDAEREAAAAIKRARLVLPLVA